MKKHKLGLRLVLLFPGLILTALGISGMIFADLGQSPISGISVALGFLSGMKTGDVMMWFNLSCFALEWIIYGRQFKKTQYLQPILAIYFSILVNLFIYDFPILNGLNGESYLSKFILVLVGIFIMVVGVSMVLSADLITFPFEGLAEIIAVKLNKSFALVKNSMDTLISVIALVLALWFAIPNYPVREATFIYALITGPMIGFGYKLIKTHILKE